MAHGISLHIGLNRVDPTHYQGWDGALNACEQDAKDMFAIAKKGGFVPQKLLTKAATTDAVTAVIGLAAKSLSAGDIFWLTYSGHGGQVPDTNGDEADGKDETWVLYDRMLVDDELYALWGQFKAGVRILVLSDSCHSGTVTKAVPAFIDGGPTLRTIPIDVENRVYRAHQQAYDGVQARVKDAAAVKVRASVLLISGCMDNQYSADGDKNGLFTGTLKQVWASGKFAGTYRKFRDQIVAKMPSDQTPNYSFIGATNAAFQAQRPFTI